MTDWIERAMPHLIVAPIVLPLVAAALMVALGDRRRVARALVTSRSESVRIAPMRPRRTAPAAGVRS